MAIHIVVRVPDHMEGVVDVGHHLDLVEVIPVHVEDDQDRVLNAGLDQGKDTEVVIGVLERGGGHGLGKSPDPETENVNCLETDEDHVPSQDVAQDPEAIRKIRNIHPKEKKINPKNEKKRIRKKKLLLHLLHLKLRKKLNRQHLIKKSQDQLRLQEVILGVQDHLVNHLGEVVHLVEVKLLNQ